MPPRKQAPQPLPTTKVDTEQQENPVMTGAAIQAAQQGGADAFSQYAGQSIENSLSGINAMAENASVGISESHNYNESRNYDENHSFAETKEESLATVHVYEDGPEGQPVKRNEKWVVVEELSDDEFQVEVANIDGYQMRKIILRFRVRGELMPNVVVMDGIRYHPTQGFQKR